MSDDWNEALKRFDEKTVERRKKAKENDEKAQQVIRKSKEQNGSDHEATSEEGPGE